MKKSKRMVTIILGSLILLCIMAGLVMYYGGFKNSGKATYTVTVEKSHNGTVKLDKLVYKEGDYVTLTITPKGAYELDTILVDGSDRTADVVDGKLKVIIEANMNVSATFHETVEVDTLVTIPDACNMRGMELVLEETGEKPIKVTVDDNNTFDLPVVSYGTKYDVTGTICGMQVSLGSLIIRTEKEEFDPSWLFNVNYDGTLDLAGGNFTYDYASNKKLTVSAKDGSVKKGDAWIATKISLSPEDVSKLIQTEGGEASFGIGMIVGDKNDYIDIWLKNWEITAPPETIYGIRSKSKIQNGVFMGAGLLTDYGKALGGEGLYFVLHYDAEDGTLESYLGDTVDTITKVGSWGTVFDKDSMLHAFKIGSNRAWGSTPVQVNFSNVKYAETLDEALGISDLTGSIDANLVSVKYGSSDTRVSDGTKVTLTREGYKTINTKVQNGRLRVASIPYGTWTLTVNGYEDASIDVELDKKLSGDIEIQYALFKDYLREAGWNDYAALDKQNYGVIIQESGPNMLVATNDKYDSVAISLNLSTEKLKVGRHGTFVKFGNEYVFIQLEPIKDGKDYKISWNGFNTISNWPPEQNNVNLMPEYWKSQVSKLSAEQIAGLNDGSLYFTLAREKNTIYAFVDGQYCNKVVLDEKYADMQCQVGLYGTSVKKGMVRNFKIEDGESYLSAHPTSGAVDAKITGQKYNVEGNTLPDGTEITFSFEKEKKTVKIKDGRISLQGLDAGIWTMTAGDYIHTITIEAGVTHTDDIVMGYDLFTDYLKEAGWNDYADLSKQNAGVITQESGPNMLIATNDKFDSVAISMNLMVEGLKAGRHGTFVKFGNEYVFIQLEPLNKGSDYKISWNGFDTISNWPPEGNNVNLKPEYWTSQVPKLSAEQIAGLNDGSLYFTLVREGNVIYSFVDGQYCNKVVLDEKYADMECQVGLYGTSLSAGMVRNFKIEDGVEYLSVHPTTGAVDAKVTGHKYNVKGNTLSDGTEITFTLGKEQKTAKIKDGKISLKNLDAGVWTMTAGDYVKKITIAIGVTHTDDIVMEYDLFTDYLREAKWNDYADLSQQNDGIIIQESGPNMLIATNDTYDSVAISLNMSTEGLTGGRHGTFIKFNNEYVFIQLEPLNGGSSYKITWNGDNQMYSWPPATDEIKNVNLLKGKWTAQVNPLSAEQIAGLNDGSLYFTLVREGNVIYAFVDGQYCNKVELDKKYADMKCQVGLYGVSMSAGMVRNFKIEEASVYRDITVQLEAELQHGTLSTNADSIKTGDKMTIVLQPEDGYVPSSLVINGQMADMLKLNKNDDGTYSYTFECNSAQVKLYAEFVDTLKVSGIVTATAGASQPWTLPKGTSVQFENGEFITNVTVGKNGTYNVTLPKGVYTVSVSGYSGQTLEVTEDAQKADINFIFDLIADTSNYTVSADESSAIVNNKWGTAKFNQLHDQFILYYTVKPIEGKTVAHGDNMGIYILEGSYRYGTQSACTGGTSLDGKLTYNNNANKQDSVIDYYTDKVPSVEEFNKNGHKYALVRDGKDFDIYLQNASGTYVKVAEFTNENFTGVQLMNWTTNCRFTDIAYMAGAYKMVNGTLKATAGASEAWKLPTGTSVKFEGTNGTQTVVVGENATYSLALPLGSYTVSAEGYGNQTIDITKDTETANIKLVFDLIANTNNYTVSADESSAIVKSKWGTAKFNQLHDQFILYYTVKPVEGKTVAHGDNMGIYILEGSYRYGTQSACTGGTSLDGKLTYNKNDNKKDSVIINYSDKVPAVDEFNNKGHKYALVRDGKDFDIYLQNASGTYVKVAEFTNENFTGVQLMNWTTNCMFTNISYAPYSDSQVTGTAMATAGSSDPWNLPEGTTIQFVNSDDVGASKTATVGRNGKYEVALSFGKYTVSVNGYSTHMLNVTKSIQKENIQLVFDLIDNTSNYTISADESSAIVKNKWGTANFNQLHDQFILYYTVKPVEGKTVVHGDNMGIYILEGSYRYGTQSACTGGTSLDGKLTYNNNANTKDSAIINYSDKVPSVDEFNNGGHKYALVRNGKDFAIYLQNASGTYVKVAEFTNEDFKGVQLMNWTTNCRFTDIAYVPHLNDEMN